MHTKFRQGECAVINQTGGNRKKVVKEWEKFGEMRKKYKNTTKARRKKDRA